MLAQILTATAVAVGFGVAGQVFPESELLSSPTAQSVLVIVALAVQQFVRFYTAQILQALHANQLKPLFKLALGFAVPVYAGMAVLQALIYTKQAPFGALSVQMAFTTERLEEILQSWTAQQLNMFLFQLGVDNLFILLYSTALAVGCVHWGGGDVKYDFAAMQYMAAVFDLSEGVLVLPFLLANDKRGEFILLASICAVIKFVLIALGIAYILLGSLRARGGGAKSTASL